MGFDTKLNVCEPNGVSACVVTPLAVLSGAAQEEETNIQEVSDCALIIFPGVEVPPEFVEGGDWN